MAMCCSLDHKASACGNLSYGFGSADAATEDVRLPWRPTAVLPLRLGAQLWMLLAGHRRSPWPKFVTGCVH